MITEGSVYELVISVSKAFSLYLFSSELIAFQLSLKLGRDFVV